jgi:hypothetical protein
VHGLVLVPQQLSCAHRLLLHKVLYFVFGVADVFFPRMLLIFLNLHLRKLSLQFTNALSPALLSCCSCPAVNKSFHLLTHGGLPSAGAHILSSFHLAAAAAVLGTALYCMNMIVSHAM